MSPFLLMGVELLEGGSATNGVPRLVLLHKDILIGILDQLIDPLSKL